MEVGLMISQVSGTANTEVMAETANATKVQQTSKEKEAKGKAAELIQNKKKDKTESAEKTLSKTQLKQLKQAIEEANRKAKLTNTAREYSYDEVTNRVCIKVTDKDTEKVIREVPTEESLKRIARMLETAGLVVDEKM